MRILVLACLCLLAAPALWAGTFTAVAWNMRWFPGGRPEATLPEMKGQMRRAQEVLKTLNPDVLMLQEVADQRAAQELCSVLPGMKVAVVSQFETRPQNLVVASRFPVDSAWWDNWKRTLGEDLPPRGYAFAALAMPDGGVLLTYSVHFKSNLGEVENNIAPRVESANQLLAHGREILPLYAPRGRTAVLIGGDFNSDPGAPRFAKDTTIPKLREAGLQWVFDNVPRSNRVTVPPSGEFPPATFDHILFSGLRLVRVRVADGGGVSDHNPVVAEFSW